MMASRTRRHSGEFSHSDGGRNAVPSQGRADSGSILFNAVWLGAVANLVVFVLWIVALRLTEIAQFESDHAHAYWLARSEAVSVMRTLKSGQAPTIPVVVSVPGGEVMVSATGTTVVQFLVRAVWGNGVDNLHFSYDKSGDRVVAWSDANPS